MATEEHESETQRLTKLYSGMSDGELERVAADASSLTEEAIQALAAEVQRRGLDIRIIDEAVRVDEVEEQDLVTIRQFRDLPEAQLAKGLLDSAGIDCYVGDANIVRMNWFISNFVGGLKLRVKAEDADATNEILNQPIPESFEVQDVGEYNQPHCPNCQSLDISFEAINKGIGLTTAYFLGVPLPIPRNVWKCNACGKQWQETEQATE